MNWVNSSYPQGPGGTWASLWSNKAYSLWIFPPFRMEFQWGCWSTLALAVTKARAKHRSSSFWMQMTFFFLNVQLFEILITRFHLAFSSTSPRSMMDLGDDN